VSAVLKMPRQPRVRFPCRLLVVALCAAIFAFCVPAHAANVSCLKPFDYPAPRPAETVVEARWPSGFRPSPRDCQIAHLQGRIEEGDYERVRSLVRANQRTLVQVYLHSPGGSVAEALRIGSLLRKYLIRVNAPFNLNGMRAMVFASAPNRTLCSGEDCICASSCALIWFGAPLRFGAVGIHRPFLTDPKYRQLAPADAATYYRSILDAMRAYGDEMEIPRPIMDKMLATGSGEIVYVSTHDERDLERAPSFGEWVDASCGRVSDAEWEMRRALGETGKRSTADRVGGDDASGHRHEGTNARAMRLQFAHEGRRRSRAPLEELSQSKDQTPRGCSRKYNCI
jgi:hypothetical protein